MSPDSAGKVLVVDDEPQNVMLLQDLLEARGYQVFTAGDGQHGLELASEQHPDVVLLDVMMPRMTGLDMCHRLKAEPSTAMIPVLLVTALGARADRLAGISAGANDFITKPIDSADLLLRVRNAVLAKQLHDQVATQLKKLRELEAARDTLTHMIVHDLRSPLTGLMGYMELLRATATESGSAEALDYTKEALAIAGRLSELISQVLDVSRLEAGQMPVKLQETDLTALLPTAVETLGPVSDGASIVFEMPDRPVLVPCDRDLIGRVVMNLVGNALKFTPRKGTVRIGLDASDGRARLSVTDEGPGVPVEFRRMIFEKFGQAPQGQSSAVRSTGLGLTFCKLAVEAHGGRIGVEAPEDGGSRFWLELPK
jgi:two-component system sensor histidine kinase/response regulator